MNPDEFSVVASDEAVDSVGDVILASGWDLTQYRRNPVVLFGHDHGTPVGTADVKVQGSELRAVIRLAKAGTSAAVDQVRALVAQRVLRGVSVGFRALEAKPRPGSATGMLISKARLYELSIVAVPANGNCLTLAPAHERHAAEVERKEEAARFKARIRAEIAELRTRTV